MLNLSDFAAEAVCLALDVAIIGVLSKAYYSAKNSIQFIQDAPRIHAESLKELSSNAPSGDSVLSPYAIVEGSVQSLAPGGNTLKSHYPKEENLKGVIQTFSLTEHKTNLTRSGFWYSSKREIHSFNNAVPFGLLLGSKSEDPTIQVLDWEEASRLDLSVTYNHFDASPSSISSHLVGWLVGDIQKGMEATEKMLEQGQEMTAIGELVRDHTGGGKFQIRPPPEKAYYLIRSPVKKLLKELEEEAKVLKWILLAFGGIGTFIIGISAYKYYLRWKADEDRRRDRHVLDQIRDERLRRRTAEEPPTPSASDSTSACVICLENPREVIVLECGHICMCSECARELINVDSNWSEGGRSIRRKICPICRADIVRLAPAYFS